MVISVTLNFNICQLGSDSSLDDENNSSYGEIIRQSPSFSMSRNSLIYHTGPNKMEEISTI